MKKYFVFFILVSLIYNSGHSQNLEITYHTDYALNAAKPNKISADRMILNIGKRSSEFYSLLRQNIDLLTARMEKKGASYDEFQTEKSKLPESSIHFRVYKNFPKLGQLTYTDRFAATSYKYTEKQEKPLWNLEKERKEILGYVCQKATTHFRGRLWTAWYAPDIPSQEGPWKLWGLPGLIMEAQDSDTLYHFLAIGIKKTTTAPIVLNKKQYINCSKEEYLKQKAAFVKNPIAAINKTTNANITITGETGKPLKPKADVGYIDIEKEGPYSK